MKKRIGVLKKDAEAIKELFAAEEKVIFEFFDWEIKKRHFYSLASIILSLSLGLFVIEHNHLPLAFVLAAFFISLAVVSLICIYRIKKQTHVTMLKMLKRVVPLYTIALFFALVYLMLNFFISGKLFGLNDIIFLTSIATIFETITFHSH